MSDANKLDGDDIPQDFWAVPEKFIKDEGLRLLHSIVCSRLREENPEADTLELMAIERVASLFFYMRDRERGGGLDTAAAYKSMLSLWVNMATDLRKSRIVQADADEIRKDVIASVSAAVRSAFEGADPEIARTYKRRIAERLGVG